MPRHMKFMTVWHTTDTAYVSKHARKSQYTLNTYLHSLFYMKVNYVWPMLNILLQCTISIGLIYR